MSDLEKVYNYAFKINFGSKSSLNLETGLQGSFQWGCRSIPQQPVLRFLPYAWSSMLKAKPEEQFNKSIFLPKRLYLLCYTIVCFCTDEQENSINSWKPIKENINNNARYQAGQYFNMHFENPACSFFCLMFLRWPAPKNSNAEQVTYLWQLAYF